MLPQTLAPLMSLPRFGPALAANALAAMHMRSVQCMFASADRIVAVCGWLHDALLANGVPREKLILSRQGIAGAERYSRQNSSLKPHDVLRFGYLGRWDVYKGVHVLVEAFKKLPERVPASLHICAVASGVEGKKYRQDAQRLVVGDRRIRFVEDLLGESGAEFLGALDVLIVPSQLLETGPLVVLEAFAAGTPVVGSDLGGIKELVKHEHNGLLVPHADGSAWTMAMVRLATDRKLFQRLCHGIDPVRTMSDVAHDMASVYRELFKTRANAA
jgi:glycosyltransferase involved in cell wall biosynthesis